MTTTTTIALDNPASMSTDELLARYCTNKWRPWTNGLLDPVMCDLSFEVGHASATLGGSHLFTHKRVWSVFVHVNHRGEGHGRRLMDVLTAYADAVGRSLDLFVATDNPAAIRLYQSVGFVIERTNEARPYTSSGPFAQRNHYMTRESRMTEETDCCDGVNLCQWCDTYEPKP